jgi:hypothetical protein
MNNKDLSVPVTTLPRSGSRVRIPSPAPIFSSKSAAEKGPSGSFSASPPLARKPGREAGGSSQKRNLAGSRRLSACAAFPDHGFPPAGLAAIGAATLHWGLYDKDGKPKWTW